MKVRRVFGTPLRQVFIIHLPVTLARNEEIIKKVYRVEETRIVEMAEHFFPRMKSATYCVFIRGKTECVYALSISQDVRIAA